MAYLRRLSALLAFTLPIALAPGCAPDLSSNGQLIECSVGAGGAISSCQPTTQTETDDPDKCIDVDEDGDDDPDDEADDGDDAAGLLGLPSEDDDDDDGTPDAEDDDDDNDGVPDVDDCDEEEGGDDDEPDDDDSLDDDA